MVRLRYTGMADYDLYRELGQQLRVDAVRASAKAGSGHPTSSMSAADLAAVLLAGHFRYDYDNPKSPANDRLIFSKGHASPLVYGLFRAAGVLSEEEFGTYRQFGSRLEGHPTPVLPWVDVATGSLGQGLPIGVGMALAGKQLDQLPFRVWVICGDSEMAEGSMWEAIEHAPYYSLDNLTAIIDVNRLGQRGETMHGWDLAYFSRRLEACGWNAIEVDGHDVEQIDAAYEEAESTTGKPTAIVAKTIKGKGYSKVENQDGWHGKAIAEEAIEELGGIRNIVVDVPKPKAGEPHEFPTGAADWPSYELGSKVATRRAYGDALAALGAADGKVVALDGEVSNSTYAEIFGKAHPERFFEMFIAEQQMVAAAVGMQVLGWKPFASTFAAFASRAYDFVRMAAISRATIRLCGSHAGVSIGEDGPSQMALEDIAEFRAIHGSTVLYPSDGNQTVKLVRAMADLEGISFLRTTRADTPVIYGPDEEFPVGGSKTVRDGDDVAIVGAGITLHEALEAAETLEAEGISARVIDLYSVKPIDAETLRGLPDADRHGRGPLARGRARRGRALDARRSRRRAAGHEARRPRPAALREARPAAERGRDRRRAHRRGSSAARARARHGLAAPLPLARWQWSSHPTSSKELGGDVLFDGVSFKVERRDRVALAGPNGAGKTTLLRLLSGETELHGGELAFQKGTRVALHDQRPPLDRALSLREYVLSGARDLISTEEELRRLEEAMGAGAHDAATLRRYGEAQARLEHAGGYAWRERTNAVVRGLGFAEVDLDRPLTTFSGGELTRASLARALSGDPDLILLDEPTNHLDVASLEWLERELQSLDAGVILVAHDRWFLEAVTNATLELVAGRATFFAGPWHAWRLEKAQRAEHAQKTADRIAVDIARLNRFVERFRYKKDKAKQAQAKLTQIGRLQQERSTATGEVELLSRTHALARVRVPEAGAERTHRRRGRRPLPRGRHQAPARRHDVRARARRARRARSARTARARRRCSRRCSASASPARVASGSVTASRPRTSRSRRSSSTSAAPCSSASRR